MTRIGVTGADGFLGWHLRAHLQPQADVTVSCAGRDVFADSAKIQAFAASCDAIAHFAGVNRGEDREVEAGNITIARALVQALKATGSRPHVVYANSIHQDRDTAYGRGKRHGAGLFAEWAAAAGARFTDLVLPHVYGEGGLPNYNSAVATFCHQLAHGETPRVLNDGDLELVHAQEVAANVVACVRQARTGRLTLKGEHLRVTELLGRLQSLASSYGNQVIPRLESEFELGLFNAYRACLFPAHYPVALTPRGDARGTLFEGVKTLHGGQCFVSTTHPGVTRGNHYHRRKIERFLVLRGDAVIRLRRLLFPQVHEFRVCGAAPCYIDMPTFHTHDITNIGTTELVTLFWTHEIYDPHDPDTYAEKV
jgi:UDP-2-acetamido-2,6-beta-L-arabino-hexul-4-ose reductase